MNIVCGIMFWNISYVAIVDNKKNSQSLFIGMSNNQRKYARCHFKQMVICTDPR